MRFWTDVVPDWACKVFLFYLFICLITDIFFLKKIGSGIFLVLMFCMNLYGARGWGEAEYWFSLIKIICVIIFVIVGCLTSGGVIGYVYR